MQPKPKKLVIGLTGGIASGKSTVLREARKLGLKTLDSDLLARQAVRPGRPAYRRMVRMFGKDILLNNRELNRARLAQIVFKNPKKRKELERIIHPEVVRRIREVSAKLRSGVLVVDIPLLFEAKLTRLVDKVLVVWAPRNIQLQRLLRRNRLTPAEAQARLRAQWPIDRKRKLADLVIDNSRAIQRTRDQARKTFRRLHSEGVDTDRPRA